MKQVFARKSATLPLLLSLITGAPLAVYAQQGAVLPTQKVLVITREVTKPGKDGTPHEKTEGAFVHALAAGKSDLHYYAATSLSGPPRALFFSAYPSFAAWQQVQKSVMSNATLSAALDRANTADGELLSETALSVWTSRDDLSLNPGFRVGARLMEIRVFHVRPGHGKEWDDLVKMVIEGYKKGVPDAHWGMYEEVYGMDGGEYIGITTLKSATEIDKGFGDDKKFADAMGEDGMKKLDELEAACVESRYSNLFMIDPKMSYPAEAMVNADPEFWKPKVEPKAPTPAKAPAQ
jgi:hypothetical protein